MIVQSLLRTCLREPLAGDVGVVVNVYKGGAAFKVEFFALEGSTAAVARAGASQVRPVTEKDVSHARPMHIPA